MNPTNKKTRSPWRGNNGNLIAEVIIVLKGLLLVRRRRRRLLHPEGCWICPSQEQPASHRLLLLGLPLEEEEQSLGTAPWICALQPPAVVVVEATLLQL